jgi:transcription factor C subunit 7
MDTKVGGGADDVVQVFWVMRHGDRLDNHDSNWKKNAKFRDDTPLSPVGHVQSGDVARFIASHDSNVKHILSSPFLRAIETASPLSKALNLPIKLEKSVWETGCRSPPPPHTDAEGFFLDTSGYESAFEPTCGERPADFRPRLARSAKILAEKFPVGSGNVCIFSHADPSAYLVTEFCGIDPTLTGPVSPCCIFRLERRQGDEKFKVVLNASIEHLSVLGKTEPCHPIHAFHDWCRLFEEMRVAKLVEQTFRWPPNKEELPILKKAWHARYWRLLTQGKTAEFPVIGPPRKSKKVLFNCLKCGVVSYLRRSLFETAPPSHVIYCWKCKGSFLLTAIPLPKQPS